MTPKTHQELVERCIKAASKVPLSGMSFMEKMTRTILSEVYAAVEEPSEAMRSAGTDAMRMENRASAVWRAMLAASPLAKEGE